MRFKALYLFIILFFISCNNGPKVHKSFYETGELRTETEFDQNGLRNGRLLEYYKTGELKAVEYYLNGQLVDTTYEYYKTGSDSVKQFFSNGEIIFEKYYESGGLEAKGKLVDDVKSGWWSYFDNEGHLNWKIEFVNAYNDSAVRNAEHPNQLIKFDPNKDTINDESNYYLIELKDSLPTNKPTFGSIKVIPQTSKVSDFHMIYYRVVDPKSQQIQNDSTYGTNSKSGPIWIVPKTPGTHQLIGYILEKGHTFKELEGDSTMVQFIESTKKMYFEKSFYVYDSIE